MSNERNYGKSKLDHALSYFAYAFEKILEFLAIIFVPGIVIEQTVLYGERHPEQVLPILMGLMIVVIIVGAYTLTKSKQWRKNEAMEQVIKRIIPSRQADQLSDIQQNCLANSNCLHVASGSFAELPAYIKSFLGIKKALQLCRAKGQEKCF